MKEWFTLAELEKENLPGLPSSYKSLDNYARANWNSNKTAARRIEGKTKPVWQYHFSLLPSAAQARLMVIHGGFGTAKETDDSKSKALWHRYETLSAKQKAVCESRLKVLLLAETLQEGGVSAGEAMSYAAAQSGFCLASLYNWRKLCADYGKADWLPALAANYSAPANKDTAGQSCPPQAWEALLSDYLRPSKPAFSACYRRVKAAAKKHKWGALPSERALRRRLDGEIGKAAQILARAGRDKAKTLFPAQRRDRSAFHAMEAVNMDGHKLDVFVKVPWADKAVRLYLIAIQDLYSGKILSWRLSEAETWDTVRLVIGDMIENCGIPETITLDNGRAFASKWISGGISNRFRFKVKQEEPQGLLAAFGIKTQWTTPYSGQSKPIERTWRDLAEAISKHPLCAGAYTGSRPDAKPEDYGARAVPLAEFAAHVEAQIAACNAQTGRKAQNCAGRSFDETFAASLAADGTIIRRATEAQRALWLLAAENVRARKGSGEIHFQGNRYWAEALNQYAGQKVTLRFDPDDMHRPIRVYDLENRLICAAACIDDTGFYDTEAARRHNKARKEFLKARAMEKAAAAALSPDRLAAIYRRAEGASEVKPVERRGKITRLATTATNAAARPKQRREAGGINQEQFEEAFRKGMERLRLAG